MALLFRLIWTETWKSRTEEVFLKSRSHFDINQCHSEVLNLVRGDFTVSCLKYPYAARKWTVNYFNKLIISQGTYK